MSGQEGTGSGGTGSGSGGSEGGPVDERGATIPAPAPAVVAPACAPARVERHRPSRELADRISALLAEPHASLVGSCAIAGVPYRTVQRWMSADVDERPDCEEFQNVVMMALERERVRDISAVDEAFESLDGPGVAKAGALVNKHLHHHANRFKRLYSLDDETKSLKLEHVGAGGGAIKTANVNVGERGLSESTRRQIVEGILGVPRAMLEAGAKMGELDMSSGGDEEGGDE